MIDYYPRHRIPFDQIENLDIKVNGAGVKSLHHEDVKPGEFAYLSDGTSLLMASRIGENGTIFTKFGTQQTVQNIIAVLEAHFNTSFMSDNENDAEEDEDADRDVEEGIEGSEGTPSESADV